MLTLGIASFLLNYALAWTIVRSHPQRFPLLSVIAVPVASSLALGLFIALVLIILGYLPLPATDQGIDVAIYFGLPAAALGAYGARLQNRLDAKRTARR